MEEEDDFEVAKPDRRSSGSYLFRAKKNDGEETDFRDKKSRGGYLFRTKKDSLLGMRDARGGYLFRTRKFDRPPNRSYLFRT